MTEHTPGPWEAAALGTIIRTKTGVNERGGMTGGVLVAQFFGADRPAEADVNLMVAAPDMYDALITALPYLETAESDEAYKPGAVAKVVKQVRNAISKAEGR